MKIKEPYKNAQERYAYLGVDTDKALKALKTIPISIHCWQGDDVGGFENLDKQTLEGGIQCTGSYPGKARNPEELRADLDEALSLIPGKHRLNLHAIYAETEGASVERNRLEPKHFQNWIGWAKEKSMGLDFNPTYFSHPKAADGFTLSSNDPAIREFWIEHGRACRKISASMGEQLGTPCIMNTWIPDGYKDVPVDRKSARELLRQSLDEMFREESDPRYHKDAVESKLFGIGSESCVVGSHEFYMGYALSRNKMLCLDTGHFHPTEQVSDKISSVLNFSDEVLLHVSRPVRWDSDHVVTLDDELQSIASEIIRGGFLERVHIGLDFFDASINRVAAWVIGARNMIKALCRALIEPSDILKQYEREGDYTRRLALLEELKSMPFGAVWDYYCEQNEVPIGISWLDEVRRYEKEVQLKRK